jgi:hypothetical protein
MTIRKSAISGIPFGDTDSRPASPSIGQTYNNGETGITEIYTSAGWVANSAPPAVISIGTATDIGTGRSYSSTGGAATVGFTPGSGGGLPSSYRINGSSDSVYATGSSSPITVTGLTPGSTYTFSGTSANSFGTSNSSGNSNQITATTVPQNPTAGASSIVTGTAYGSSPSATLTFTAGNTGGTSITNYKYSTDGTTYTAFSPAQTTSPLTVSSLTAGTAYTFNIKAVNANGDSTASTAYSSLTAATAPQTVTLGTVTRTSDTVVSIPVSGATGGSTITSYTVTSSPSISLTTSGTSSPITATGSFVIDTNYTFAVTATNAAGTSSSSSASNSLKPNPKTIGSWADSGTYAVTYTLGSSGSSNGSNIYSLTGRGASNGYAPSPLIYTRTAASTTWSSTSSSYPTGYGQYHAHFKINSRWYLGNSEYGGPQTGWYSWPYSGTTWVTETTYPISVCYSAGAQIGSTGYAVGGIFQGTTNLHTPKVYSYTGSGSWTAQTDYPINIRANRQVASLNSKVYIVGGSNDSASVTNVYSYTGSGSWSAETSLPETANNVIAANGRIYSINNNGKVYSYSGSGTWKLENTQTPYNSGTLGTNDAASLAELSSNLYMWAGNYTTPTTYVAVAALL